MAAPAAAPTAGRSPGPPWPLLAAGLAACLGYLASEIYLLGRLGFPLDDSWIHLQFAKSLARGDGLAYNPGELVTGSTAPLWTTLLSLLFWLPGDVFWWTKLLGIALYLGGVDATWRLARELGLSRGPAALAAGLTLATGPLVWSALSGMEVPLFVWLSLWGTILHLRERADPARPPLSFALLALGVLARPEGALLLLLAAADRLLVPPRAGSGAAPERSSIRGVAVGLGLAACALAGPLLFYRWAGGSFLPTTYTAKGAGDVRRFLPDLQYLYVVFGIFFRPHPYVALLAGGGAARLLARLGTPRDRGLLPALWLFGLPLAYSFLSPTGRGLIAGNFGRYYFPMFPFLAVLGVLGLERAAAALGGLPRPVRALLVALLFWPTATTLVQGAGRYVQNVANVEDSDVALARWLAPRLHPDALLAVNDIGALKYLLPNRVVDLVGIASPDLRREVARATAAGEPWDRAMLAALDRRRPDYLVIFPSWFPALAGDPRFPLVHLLRIPDNITMGGDEIAVYATPWTRHPLRQVPEGR